MKFMTWNTWYPEFFGTTSQMFPELLITIWPDVLSHFMSIRCHSNEERITVHYKFQFGNDNNRNLSRYTVTFVRERKISDTNWIIESVYKLACILFSLFLSKAMFTVPSHTVLHIGQINMSNTANWSVNNL